MKSKLLLITCILAINITCRSNTVSEHEVVQVESESYYPTNVKKAKRSLLKNKRLSADSIELSNISVKKSNSTGIAIGISIYNLTQAFGAPDSIKTEYWEMEEKNATIYKYQDARFAFIDDVLNSYVITGADFMVGSSTSGYFKVGDHLNTVASSIPNYLDLKKSDHLAVPIVQNGIHTDTFISIEFEPQSVIITKISIQSY